ncbi:MAG: LCP family protein [Lachnospiraceae bacterium]|nr:LCP family protein [Lachnospiraceae bacterium]
MKEKKKSKVLKGVCVFIVCIAILAVMGIATFAIVSNIGKQNLKQKATSTAPVLTNVTVNQIENEEKEEEDVLKEGQIYYNGQKYQYNEDIMTFVIMGIDYMGTVEELLAESMGGQSDMNFLAVLNPHEKSLKLIMINRNSMTQIQRFATDGTYVDTVDAQITLQHAYGTGGTDSCEKMVAAIDNLMYMILIHGYFAMNMGAITTLNDAIGGVELVAMEDIKHYGTDIKRGETVHLLGEDAFWYAKFRNQHIPGSANARLERQKQYLNAFLQKMKRMVKEDMALLVDLYKIVAEYSVTDVSVDEMTYLVSQMIGYSFDLGSIYSVPGETVVNGEYEEYYVDEEALYEMIVDIFYEPIMEGE